MAYTRNYTNYSRRSYARPYYAPQAPRKKSGGKFVNCGDDTMVVSAWRVNKNKELLVLYARPYRRGKGTSMHKGKRGEFYNYFVTITNKTNYSVIKTSGLLYPDDKRLLLPEFGEIVTANGRGGTWCSVIKRNRY